MSVERLEYSPVCIYMCTRINIFKSIINATYFNDKTKYMYTCDHSNIHVCMYVKMLL